MNIIPDLRYRQWLRSCRNPCHRQVLFCCRQWPYQAAYRSSGSGNHRYTFQVKRPDNQRDWLRSFYVLIQPRVFRRNRLRRSFRVLSIRGLHHSPDTLSDVYSNRVWRTEENINVNDNKNQEIHNRVLFHDDHFFPVRVFWHWAW